MFFCQKAKRSVNIAEYLIPSYRPIPIHQTHFLHPVAVDLFQVSTADQRRTTPKAMISCNKKTLYLPQEMPAIYLEFTEYYFPDGKDYPSKTTLYLLAVCWD